MIKRYGSGIRLSSAVEYNGVVYLAGLTCEDTSLDIKEQAKVVFQLIDALLGECGTDKSRLLSTNIWLSDMGDYDAFNEEWDQWVDSSSLPVRACVEARMAKPGYAVEVMVTAARYTR